MIRLRWLSLAVAVLTLSSIAQADSNFDLSGPPLDIKVMRAGVTLPIAEVPDLKVGDRLWLHPNFPDQQSARYLLVAVFLRGSTNPPPKNWFTRAETWDRKIRDEGVYVTVPSGAEQALIFLAPETGGDFSTLRSNVQARPGAFVRAAQDLSQASLDRLRLDRYLKAVTQVSNNDPASLESASKLLARSLNIRVESTCFDKPSNQQLICLTQSQNAMVLDDAQTNSMVRQWTSGESADLIGHLSQSSLAGGGAYSAYVGAVVDVVRIMNGIHTARYQYIPALMEAHREEVTLKLNNPPSFTNPKSVLTMGLPGIHPPQLPPMRAVHPDHVYCIENPSLLLPVEGAPLVYSTDFGHHWTLQVPTRDGGTVQLPAQPIALRGGFAVDTSTIQIASMEPVSKGVLRGQWGFDPFDGPGFQLISSHPSAWTFSGRNENYLIVGRTDTLHLKSSVAPCVVGVSVEGANGRVVDASYKLVKPDELELGIPLEHANPGTMTLMIQQAGMAEPDKVKVEAYAVASRLDGFVFHAGDQTATLEGSRLDQVSKLEVKSVVFTPGELKSSGAKDSLTLSSTDTTPLKAGEKATARAILKDGRTLTLPVTIERARPSAVLVSKSVEPGKNTTAAIRLTNQNELPQDGAISFVLRASSTWPRDQVIEVASEDKGFKTILDVKDGSLMLQDANTVLATLQPLKSFGPSAFGPLRFRAVDGDSRGDWQPLGNLVRIPQLKDVHCPASPGKLCSLSGSNLFLLDSVSASPKFHAPVDVPIGFADSTLDVPRPYGTLLYIKLRDDPTAVNVVSLPVLPSD